MSSVSIPLRSAKKNPLETKERKGGNAWTAKNQDFSQYLVLDLGDVMNVTGIATQGRNSPKEFVMEYGISFGSNGLDYADYREIDGSTKVIFYPPSVTNALWALCRWTTHLQSSRTATTWAEN